MVAKERKAEREHRFCPYCDEEISETAFPYCKACEVEVFYCPECKKPLSRNSRICPNCGAEIKG